MSKAHDEGQEAPDNGQDAQGTDATKGNDIRIIIHYIYQLIQFYCSLLCDIPASKFIIDVFQNNWLVDNNLI